MHEVLDVKLTNQEMLFLRNKGFYVSSLLPMDIAYSIVDKLGDEDYGIAADIITKITTHPNW